MRRSIFFSIEFGAFAAWIRKGRLTRPGPHIPRVLLRCCLAEKEREREERNAKKMLRPDASVAAKLARGLSSTVRINAPVLPTTAAAGTRERENDVGRKAGAVGRRARMCDSTQRQRL